MSFTFKHNISTASEQTLSHHPLLGDSNRTSEELVMSVDTGSKQTHREQEGDLDTNHSRFCELDGEKSVFEKKCLLINDCIDGMGMGRYQWFIWGLCGGGYFIDLLWAQAFGLVLSPIQQELGFNSTIITRSFPFGLGLTL